MKKNILKLFYLPIVFFILISFFYYISMYFIVKHEIQSQAFIIKQSIIKEKKYELKNKVENLNNLINLIRKSVYSTTSKELDKFLEIFFIKNDFNKLYINSDLIIGKIPKNKKFSYKIMKNKYIFLKYKNNKYIAAINKNFVDNIVLNNIKEYLDLQKDNTGYFALAKIITFSPDKKGYFARIFYMPKFLKYREGKLLSVKNPDIKGNYFRKKYLNCIKNGKSCYIKYYFLNPKNKQIEEKLSFVTLNKFYKLIILRGFYESQLKKILNNKINNYVNKINKLLLIGIIVYFIIFVFFMMFLYLVLKKIKNSLITEFQELKTELQKKYYYDELTNLPRRNKLLEDVIKASSLMILDIKNFSQINEIYGYKTGNEVLKFVAKSLQELYEKVYRIGDEKFVVLLDKALTLEEISIKYHTFFFSYNQFINITFIIGASNKKENLLKTAEIALSYALSQHKDYILFDEKIEKSQKEKYAKIKFLEDTLINDRIIPFYQCIVNKNQEIIKYEALIRIIDDDKILAPNEFLEHTKDSNLYNAFSRNMILKVINDLRNGIISKASINLSFEDINDEIIRNILYNLVDEDIGKKLIIEILETESINNFKFVKKFILDMKAKGIKIAIDDFGSGYSNFIVVLDLYPDYLKIDASLVKNINEPKYLDIVKMIINFSHRYNMTVVAEYVDSKNIFEKLLELGVDEFQGYYFCEPQSLENIIKEDKISSKKDENED